VAWHPTIDNLLVSGSHDNTVKLWDIRSQVPVFTTTPHTNKVLCVDIDKESNIYSGAADGKLKIQLIK